MVVGGFRWLLVVLGGCRSFLLLVTTLRSGIKKCALCEGKFYSPKYKATALIKHKIKGSHF